MKKISICLALLLILSLNLISAPPPFEIQTFPEGLDVILNQQNVLAINTNYTLRVHPYNHSTGEKIDNTSTTCDLHWNMPNGAPALFEEMNYNLTTKEFYLFISEGNFSTRGLYPWIIECQFDDGGTIFGGFTEGLLKINRLGVELELGEAIFYLVMLFAILSLLALMLVIFILTPYSNIKAKTNDGMAIVKVTLSKYIKLMSGWIAYGLLLWFMVIIRGMAFNYIFFDGIINTIGDLTIFLGFIGIGLSLFMVWFIFLNIWKDIILNKTILKEGKALLSEL